MKDLIKKIESENSWGKIELSLLIGKVSSSYTKIVMAKQCMLTSNENIKDNMIIDTCNHILVNIQTFPSWGKNEVKEIIFKKLIEELTC